MGGFFMEKQYQAKQYEKNIYDLWEKSDSFSPNIKKNSKPFCIIMPPPNANDPLHVGHAMFVTIEDVLIRFHRMLGDATLWLPGADHAGIETQFVFEKKLAKIGKSRFDYDRDSMYKLIWDYVLENSNLAVEQMKRLGASADWKRFCFTLDDKIVQLVLDTFIELHKDKLIYRDLKLVNYCTKCGTAFSDLEVKHEERKTKLYYLKYGPFVLATVRPETKFGDTAVAVNPKDERYSNWVGKDITVSGLLGDFKIKVIADEYVDKDFGTGVVKVTPAHDPNDFEIWKRHKKEIPGPKQIINFDGKLNQLTGKYAGLSVKKAREMIIDDLAKKGLISKVDNDYTNSVGLCYRCGREIEPLPLTQFFIKVKPLVKKALEALDNKRVKIYGAGHDKIMVHWLNTLKDWNVSRQIVWGIRMPVWYKLNTNLKNKEAEAVSLVNNSIYLKFLDKDKNVIEGLAGKLIKKYNLDDIKPGLQQLKAPMGADYIISKSSPGAEYIQDTDTFDTWFSSAQWPFVTLQTTKKDDYKRFYPTQVMETAYDILPFWVMRMLMLGLYRTKNIPFQHVYFHGLIRDEKGQKMSKSKGNVLNPLDLVEKYGADALRMALVMSTTAGKDSSTGEEKIRGMRNLTNKIWNVGRFIEITCQKFDYTKEYQLSPIHKEVLKFVDQVCLNTTKQLKEFKIGLAAEHLYHYFWEDYASHWLEKLKILLKNSDENSKTTTQYTLLFSYISFLRLLHPFLPYVTEAVYQELRKSIPNIGKLPEYKPFLLMNSRWPSINA
jgi:valyl-tRNA synthetase